MKYSPSKMSGKRIGILAMAIAYSVPGAFSAQAPIPAAAAPLGGGAVFSPAPLGRPGTAADIAPSLRGASPPLVLDGVGGPALGSALSPQAPLSATSQERKDRQAQEAIEDNPSIPSASIDVPAGPAAPALPVPVSREAAEEAAPRAAERSKAVGGKGIPKRLPSTVEELGRADRDVPGMLPSLYDGYDGARHLSSDPPGAPRAGRSLSRQVALLREAASPLRTRAQIEKLSKAGKKEDEAVRFAWIGDAEPGRFAFSRVLFNVPGVFQKILKKVQDHPLDFVIQGGDMVSRGVVRNFFRFLRMHMASGLKLPYFTLPGNHDRSKPHGDSDLFLYQELFGNPNYAFDHGGVRFVVIDTSRLRMTPEQLDWLDRTLDTDKRKIIFTHVMPASIGAWARVGPLRAGSFKEGADEFTRIAAKRGVDRVYAGHIHGLAVADHMSVRYVLSGGGGSPLYPSQVRDRFHHYLTVEISREGIKETVHRMNGDRWDRFPLASLEQAN